MLSFSCIMQVNAADNFFLAAYVEENKKKRTSKAKSAQSSIIPIEHEAPQASMSFPPRLASYKLMIMVK